MPAIKKHTENAHEVKAGSRPELVVADIHCPRCHSAFTCNAADIKQCQCWGVGLGPDEFEYLKQQGFTAEQAGCLCRQCLLQIQETVKMNA